MLCDPRVISKPYGRRIWQSLPPFKRTREQAGRDRLLPAARDTLNCLRVVRRRGPLTAQYWFAPAQSNR
jgi:hypothetical protein